MGLILFVLVALLVGMRLGRSWALAIPLALAAAVALGLSATGRTLNDTPLAFLVVVGTGAVGAGIVIGRSRRRIRA